MDYRRMTAPCGLDCFNCPIHLSIKDERLQKALGQRLNVSPEMLSCQGCRAEKGMIPFLNLSAPCAVYTCTEEKGIHNCSECPDFPCDRLHPYSELAAQRPHNIKVFNLALIRKMGLEKWALEKAKSVRDTYFKGKFKL